MIDLDGTVCWLMDPSTKDFLDTVVSLDKSTTLSCRVQIILYIELYVSIQLNGFIFVFSLAIPHSLIHQILFYTCLTKEGVSMYVCIGLANLTCFRMWAVFRHAV